MHKKAAACHLFFFFTLFLTTRQTNGCPRTTFHPVTHWSQSRSAWQTGALGGWMGFLLSALCVFLCSLSDVLIHKTHTHTHTHTHAHTHTHTKKHVLVLCSSAFVHQFSEGPVQINYSSCIVVFLILTVKVTLLSPTVLKAIHELRDDSCRRREMWHHSSQWGSKSRDVDVW